MKLIIDIPENIYEMVTNTGTFGCYRFDTRKAIKKGVLLDEIRAEIEQIQPLDYSCNECTPEGIINKMLNIIDKYNEE